jgi:hypothetical protein
VSAPEPESVTDVPAQTSMSFPASAVGKALTVTTIAALEALVQKLASVCVTEYEPDVVNVAFLPDAPLLHKYPEPEFDLKSTEPPSQKVVADKAVIVGVAGKA